MSECQVTRDLEVHREIQIGTCMSKGFRFFFSVSGIRALVRRSIKFTLTVSDYNSSNRKEHYWGLGGGQGEKGFQISMMLFFSNFYLFIYQFKTIYGAPSTERKMLICNDVYKA